MKKGGIRRNGRESRPRRNRNILSYQGNFIINDETGFPWGKSHTDGNK